MPGKKAPGGKVATALFCHRMRIFLIFFFFILPVLAITQEIPPDLRRKMEDMPADSTIRMDQGTLFYPEVPKGKITFSDGTSARFTNLNFSGDSLFYTNPRGTLSGKPLTEIKEVAESMPKAGEGSLIGGAAGLVVGLLTGILAYPENSFWDTFNQLFSSEEGPFPKISKRAIPLIISITVAGTGIGALEGARYKRTVYERVVPKSPSILRSCLFPTITTGTCSPGRLPFNYRQML